MNNPVAAARNHRVVSSANAARDSDDAPTDAPVIAEDRNLGSAPVTIPKSAPLAPTPPRAAVDREAARPDDPADFELPDPSTTN